MSMVRYAALLLAVMLWVAPQALAASPDTHQITFENLCKQTIWVGQVGPPNDGWELAPQATVIKTVPFRFSGRWWPRTNCKFDKSTNKCPTEGVDCCDSGGCLATEDSHYFGLHCKVSGNAPVSLFEVTFDAPDSVGVPYDTLDLSMVDGFSVPMRMSPDAGSYPPSPNKGHRSEVWCKTKGWANNPTCPTELWDAAKQVCWGPCKYYTVRKGKAETTTNGANICCSNANLPHPNCDCAHNKCLGGFGCSAGTPEHRAPGADGEKCYAKTPGKHGYWGSIVDKAWPNIKTQAVQYITNINQAVPGVYAWQFDDLNSTFECAGSAGGANYTVTFCPAP